MAKADFIKFQELLNSDAEFREKFRTAVGNYTGSPELQEVFEKVILPLGEERGLSATYEEFAGYMKALSEGSQAELSEDELAQVAGGKVSAAGVGALGCQFIGAGLGGGGGTDGGGICVGIGMGGGGLVCLAAGINT